MAFLDEYFTDIAEEDERDFFFENVIIKENIIFFQTPSRPSPYLYDIGISIGDIENIKDGPTYFDEFYVDQSKVNEIVFTKFFRLGTYRIVGFTVEKHTDIGDTISDLIYEQYDNQGKDIPTSLFNTLQQTDISFSRVSKRLNKRVYPSVRASRNSRKRSFL